ncbi:hypothetical protein BBP40_011026 [Aspergillus hancockii]|nr:hypothetical protein BBP40_011026 [Aspergillus hancockii]
MVYYAYLKNYNDDWSYRYMFVTPDKETLDAWYDAVLKKVGGDTIRRLSADFFSYDRNKFYPGDCTRPGKETPEFIDKLMITLLNDRDGRVISTFDNGHWASSA